MSSGAKPKDLTRKAHYVPSRYKQAAEKVSNQANLSKERSTFLKSTRDNRGHQIPVNVSQGTSNGSKLSISESNRGMTSTPTSKGEIPLSMLDASAVVGSDGYLTAPHSKDRIGPLSADNVKRNLTKRYKSQDMIQQSQHSVFMSYREKKKTESINEKVVDAEIDLLYAYYLQAAFLESEAKKALEIKSTNAIENLHKLFTLVLQHLYKVKSKKCTLKILSSLIGIHEHCQKQEIILKPLLEIIPVFEDQYRSLTEAVNSTKHKLHVKDVIFPASGFEGDIVEILEKMTKFIQEFFDMLPNYKDIISSSDSLKSYVGAGEMMNEALKRGLNLLVEARDLCFSEASLSFGC